MPEPSADRCCCRDWTALFPNLLSDASKERKKVIERGGRQLRARDGERDERRRRADELAQGQASGGAEAEPIDTQRVQRGADAAVGGEARQDRLGVNLGVCDGDARY
eukprot:203622-Pleurochrysis_carterae.AAC.1